MPRPRREPEERLACTLQARVSAAEAELIRAAAAKAGVTVSEYVRRMALSGKLEVHAPRGDVGLTLALNRIGVNLNQMARRLNQSERLPVPALLATLARINAYLDQVDRR